MKRGITIWGIVVFLLFLFACTKDVGQFQDEFQVGNIKMRINASQRVSEQMMLEITSIKDYRCPIGVLCTTDGDVVINFKVQMLGQTIEEHISYNESSSSVLSIQNHSIKVLNVRPYPFANGEMANETDYTVEIIVEKETI